MQITLVFKTRICAKETYPKSFEVKFAREIRTHFEDYKDEKELFDIIFNNAHEFEQIITQGLHVVDSTTECLGCSFVHDAKNSELLDLARLGIERI